VIEPHLGTLNNVKAAMPIPQGTVEVQYVRGAGRVEARLKLPAGVGGELLWRGRQFSLHGGEQTISLPY